MISQSGSTRASAPGQWMDGPLSGSVARRSNRLLKKIEGSLDFTRRHRIQGLQGTTAWTSYRPVAELGNLCCNRVLRGLHDTCAARGCSAHLLVSSGDRSDLNSALAESEVSRSAREG